MTEQKMTLEMIVEMDEKDMYEGKRNKRTSFDKEIKKDGNMNKTVAEIRALVETVNALPAIEPAAREMAVDFVAYIMGEYGFPKDIAEVVYSKAYMDGHAGGIYEINTEIIETSEYTMDILEIALKTV